MKTLILGIAMLHFQLNAQAQNQNVTNVKDNGNNRKRF